MAIKISGTTVIDDDRNIENVGVITATSFVGDGSGLIGVGVGTEDSINTSGIITATTISANEFIGTGDKLIFSPSATSFSPTDGSTDQSASDSIIITFDQPIYTGVGSIFFRNSSGIGTEILAIGVNSTSVSISNQTLTINPPDPLPIGTNIYVVLPSQSIENAVGGFIATISDYNYTTSAFEFNSIVPANGATGVAGTSNITINFSDVPVRGTGTVFLRNGSAGGTLIESFDAASAGEISISGNDWILNPNVDSYVDPVFLVVPNTAIENFTGINTTGGEFTYSYTPTDPAPGDNYGGGIVMCVSGGTRWIVAPTEAQISRTWYEVSSGTDAVTIAQACTGCTDWFLPSGAQYQNPGFVCRTYWDSLFGGYWTNVSINSCCGQYVYYYQGAFQSDHKQNQKGSRAFRTVSY
jgi:hypothetical protein